MDTPSWFLLQGDVMPKVLMLDGRDLFGGASWQQHTTTNDWSCKNPPAVDGVLTGKRRKGRCIALRLIAYLRSNMCAAT